MARIDDFYTAIQAIDDPRIKHIIAFHRSVEEQLIIAKGSNTKHQAWQGGYIDHILQSFEIAKKIHPILDEYETGKINLSSALVVLLFHDIEKIFKYGNRPDLSAQFDKENFLYVTLKEKWNISFSKDELNALKYVHGEGEDYHPIERKMGRLAAFVHSIDTLSARALYEHGTLGNKRSERYAL